MVTMESQQRRQIKIIDETIKRWSQPSCIITPEDLAAAETEHDGCEPEQLEQIPLDKHVEIVKRVHPAMRDIFIHTEQQIERATQQTFKTPQKVSEHSNKLLNISNMSPNIHPEKHRHSVLGDKSDWMLAERSNSRSPPSPAVMSRSPEVKCKSPLVHMSPLVHTNSNSVFNFSPERTERYRSELELESGRVKKRLFDGTTQGHEVETTHDNPSPSFLTSLPSPSYRRREPYLSSPHPHPHPHPHFQRDLSRDVLAREALEPEVPYYLDSPSSRGKMMDYFSSRENCFQSRAKRRLDVDEEYVSTPKRLKSDFEREMGYRYLQQLESDMASLRDKLTNQEQEPQKMSSCTCAIMERQFLQMAESAYRSVRRIDASPQGFEQFRRELIQTNEVMKDSMDVLKNIRTFCEHKS